jgi:hypothetical protein
MSIIFIGDDNTDSRYLITEETDEEFFDFLCELLDAYDEDGDAGIAHWAAHWVDEQRASGNLI